MNKHPSGRPIRRQDIRKTNYPRVPYNEPLVPGLRKYNLIEAIGFTSNLLENDRQDDDQLKKR